MLTGTLLHLALLLLFAPLWQGVIVKTKALFAGRVGAPPLQLYYDLLRLLRKACTAAAMVVPISDSLS